jgi:2-amino-4-hydroxy-6-hydroxymethyldihydropteridine diphosphokinase
VTAALADLARLGRLRASSLYRTEPLGDPDQPWYVNAVAQLETGLLPLALLDRLQELERIAGRPPHGVRWAPRRLDLDLLFVDGIELATPRLVLPHPELAHRRFVLEPLCEIAPDLRDPRSGRTVRDLLAHLDDPLRVEKLCAPPMLAASEDEQTCPERRAPTEAQLP